MNYKILNTVESKKKSIQINNFENQYYETDLQYDLEYFNHWLSSESFLNNAALDENNEIVGSCSFLITDKFSFYHFTNGNIREFNLNPINLDTQRNVYLYYCSLVAINKEISKKLLATTYQELKTIMANKKLIIHDIFAIGCTPEGMNHLTKNCFLENGNNYQNKYPIYELVITKHQKYFWNELINKEKRPLTRNKKHRAESAKFERHNFL